MDKTKQKKLAAAGFRTGDAKDFLGLTDEEAAFVELKLALADFMRDVRVEHGWTQTHVARLIGGGRVRLDRPASEVAPRTRCHPQAGRSGHLPGGITRASLVSLFPCGIPGIRQVASDPAAE
jgi:hypothetical protein